MCLCIYLLQRLNGIVMVYDYVDDFSFTGSDREITNPVRGNGADMGRREGPGDGVYQRSREASVVKITITGKICDICQKSGIDLVRNNYISMSESEYIKKNHKFDSLINNECPLNRPWCIWGS